MFPRAWNSGRKLTFDTKRNRDSNQTCINASVALAAHNFRTGLRRRGKGARDDLPAAAIGIACTNTSVSRWPN